MKKLNNKGFTLIELLAVIVILAIVVAITIPSVLSSIDNTRKKAFQTSVDTVADWVERQYQAFLIGDETVQNVDSAFASATNGCGNLPKTPLTAPTSCALGDKSAFLKAAGVNPNNYDLSSVSITVNTSGRACVKMKANTTDGDYKNVTAELQSPAC